MKRIGMLSLLLCLMMFVAGDAYGQYPSSEKMVSIEAKDMPLNEVIDILFRDSGHSYSIDQSITDLKVTANLQNVSFEEALKIVVRASGLVYRMDGSTISISPKPVINQASMEPVPAGQPSVTEVVTLKQKQISSGDIASVISKPGKVSVTTIGSDKLIITGSREDVDEALKLVKALDMDGSLARPIRIKLEAKVTSPSLKEPAILTTESVGAEGSSIPLNANAETMIPYNVTVTTITDKGPVQNTIQQFLKVVGGLFVNITPKLSEDGRISLSGSGKLAHTFLGEKKSDQTVPEQVNFNKDFEVAISVPQGKPTIIATASSNLDKHIAKVEITATAVVEEGKVFAPSPDSSRIDSPGYVPGHPSVRSSYGGSYGGYGGYGGSSFGGGSFGGSYGGYSAPMVAQPTVIPSTSQNTPQPPASDKTGEEKKTDPAATSTQK